MSGRRGFTVVELMVALVIAGIVLLIAKAEIAQASADSRRVIELRQRLEERAAARRWLAAVFRSLQVGQGDRDGFAGSPSGIEFTARMETVAGWAEPRLVRLGLAGERLVLAVGVADTIPLLDNIAAVETQYLLSSGARSEWLRGWYSPATAPVAVRLIVHRRRTAPGAIAPDTLLFAIGSRG